MNVIFSGFGAFTTGISHPMKVRVRNDGNEQLTTNKLNKCYSSSFLLHL